MQLQQVVSLAEEINVVRDGVKQTYGAGSEPFGEIVDAWEAMTVNSVVMPAFGVSLNEHTLNAMQSGVWAEFCFAESRVINGLPFEKLLIEVKPEYAGFNLNRYTRERGYGGRCFYIDLRGGNMQAFYELLTK